MRKGNSLWMRESGQSVHLRIVQSCIIFPVLPLKRLCLVSSRCSVQLTINPQHRRRRVLSLTSKSSKVRMSFYKGSLSERNFLMNLAELGGWVVDSCDESR